MSDAMATAGGSNLDRVDLTDRELYRHGFPHEVFTTLRREAPIWWHPETAGPVDAQERGFWVLSRHAHIQAASRNPALFSAEDGPSLGDGLGEQLDTMMTNMDGPRHLRQRKLISAGFTPRMIGKLEEQARGWAVKILERAIEQEQCDFVDDVAYQLPMHMIADIVGIPESDRAWLFSRLCDFLQCSDPEYPVSEQERPAIGVEIFQYGQKLSAEKRARPVDDVWSLLTSVELEDEDGSRSSLGEFELDAFFFLLTAAGSETTRNAISLGMQALLDDPGQLAALRRDPGILRTGTDEIIRWSSPVAYFRRTVREDCEFEGVKMAEGDRISMWYPSGNRDESAFEDPFRFDIRREHNEHVALGGGGAHFCMGAHLARREIMILFEELVARVGSIEVLGEPGYSVQGIFNPIVTSLKKFPVRLSPA
jgi:cytochrome P450